MSILTRAELNEQKRLANRRRERAKLYGRYVHPLVSPEPARAHIADLRRYGLSLYAIGRLGGWDDDRVIGHITNPNDAKHQQRINRDTEARILAIRFDLAALEPQCQIDVIGTRRRVQALHAIGWTRKEIARRLGRPSVGAINSLLHPCRRYITVENARAISDLYDELSMRPGPSRRAVKLARDKGWPTPLQWDDDKIDDPDAVPHAETRSALRTSVDVAAELEDLLDVVDPAITAEQASARLGYRDAQSIYLALKRADRPDLRARLDRNNEAANPAPLVTKADAYGRRKKEQAA